MGEQKLALIELTNDELLAVAGGDIAGIVQSINQSAAVVQWGGDVGSFFGGATETLTGAISQIAENYNSGDVRITVR